MLSFDKLHTQNHQIAELAKVLSFLFEDRAMCDTEVVCELFERYQTTFDEHVTMNRSVYTTLLSSANADASSVANRFIEGEKEIKRIFHNYKNKWCKAGLMINNHQEFRSESEVIYRLVQDRIQAESEQLYPLARKLSKVAA